MREFDFLENSYHSSSEKHYRKISKRQIRSTSREESITMEYEIYPALLDQTRSVMGHKAFGIFDIYGPPESIDGVIILLEQKGFSENNTSNTSGEKPQICSVKLISGE